MGQKQTLERTSGMSALTPRADILSLRINVGLVPQADIYADTPGRAALAPTACRQAAG
jgi:hypothetical protein